MYKCFTRPNSSVNMYLNVLGLYIHTHSGRSCPDASSLVLLMPSGTDVIQRFTGEFGPGEEMEENQNRAKGELTRSSCQAFPTRSTGVGWMQMKAGAARRFLTSGCRPSWTPAR